MDDFDVVMVDARNHGQSGAGAADIKCLAADLAAVVTGLELGAVSALGHSVGASVVTALAADYPHLVTRLLLEDPPWRQPQSEDSSQRKSTNRTKAVLHRVMLRFASWWRRWRNLAKQECCNTGVPNTPPGKTPTTHLGA